MGRPPHNHMAGRASSIDSVSTASDATVEEWEDDKVNQTLFDADTEAIPLRTFGAQSDDAERPTWPQRGYRRYLPHDRASLCILVGVTALIISVVLVMPWLAGSSEKRTPKHAGNATSTPSNVTSTLLSLSSVLDTASSLAVPGAPGAPSAAPSA